MDCFKQRNRFWEWPGLFRDHNERAIRASTKLREVSHPRRGDNKQVARHSELLTFLHFLHTVTKSLVVLEKPCSHFPLFLLFPSRWNYMLVLLVTLLWLGRSLSEADQNSLRGYGKKRKKPEKSQEEKLHIWVKGICIQKSMRQDFSVEIKSTLVFYFQCKLMFHWSPRRGRFRWPWNSSGMLYSALAPQSIHTPQMTTPAITQLWQLLKLALIIANIVIHCAFFIQWFQWPEHLRNLMDFIGKKKMIMISW
jgi:hypothetical protein